MSGEVASSRERPGSGASATFVIGRSGLTFGFCFDFAARAVQRGSRVAPSGRRLGHNPRQNGRRGGATAG